MSQLQHDALVASQFGSRASAYVTSAVHAQGEDLRDLAALVTGAAGAHVLDLGCGGGHASFAVAPHVAKVVAYDLSAAMLEAVTAEAAVRGIANLTTRQGPAEALPFADASFDVVITRFSAHHWADMPAGIADPLQARASWRGRGSERTMLIQPMLEGINIGHPCQGLNYPF